MFGHTFNHDIFHKAHLIFGNLFNDIRVVRRDKQGNRVQTIDVPLEYGPRQKTLTAILTNPDFTKPTSVIVPRMSFEFTTLTRNSSLQLQKTQQHANWQSNNHDRDKLYTQFVPVPYQMGIELSIYTKNAYDAFQIVEQILPYFAPEWSVSANFVPEMDYREDVKIVLGPVNFADNAETAAFEDRRVIVFTLNFTMNIPMFGPVNNSGLIKRVITNFYTPPGAGEISDADIISTPAIETYELVPGLTADGRPTSNTAESINYSLINIDDPYGFCETWTDWSTGKTSTSGEVLAAAEAAELIRTQRASTSLIDTANALQIKVQNIHASSGDVTIDLQDGEYIILHLEGNVGTVSFDNWTSGILHRCTVEIRNTGAYDVNSWSGAIWNGGEVPNITSGAGKKDIFAFMSADAGTTIYGTIIGTNFS